MNLLKSKLTKATACFLPSKWMYLSKCSKTSSCKPEIPSSNMKLTELPNGMRIVTQQYPSYITSIALFVAVGPRFEDPELNGISHFIEHMAYKGFRSMSRSKFEDFVDESGTKFEVKTRRDMQVFRANLVDPCAASSVVKILTKVVTDLEFSDEEIDCEKYNMCLKLIEKDRSPRAVVFDYLYQTAFQGTPLGQSIIGTTNNIRNFDGNIAACFINDRYVPGSMVLAAAGKVAHDDMVRFAESRLGALLPPECPPNDVYCPCRYTGSEATYRDDSMDLAHVVIAVEAPGFNNPDYLPMLVAKNSMGHWHLGIGGKENNGIILAKKVSVCDICFSYKSFYLVHCDVGLWGIYFITHKYAIHDMVAQVQSEWMRLVSVMLQTDLNQAKCWTKHKLARRVCSAPGVVNDLGTQVLQTGGRISYPEYFKMIDQMSLSTFKNSVGKYLEDKCPAVSAMGPIEDLPEYSRTRAGMYWLRV